MAKITKKINYKLVDLLDTSRQFDFDNQIKNSKNPVLCVNFDTENGLKNSYGEDIFYCRQSSSSTVKIYPDIVDAINIRNIFYFVGTPNAWSEANKQLLTFSGDFMLRTTILDNGGTTTFDIKQFDTNSQLRFLPYNYENTYALILSVKTNSVLENYLYKGYGDTPTKILDEYRIFDIINFDDKMFVVFDEKYTTKICYTYDLNPLNLQGNLDNLNILQLPLDTGKIQKLIKLEDYLFVFCEYGIYKITSYKTQEEITVEKVYVGTSKIIEKTIMQGASDILFADENGVYSFNGNSVEQVKLNFESLFYGVDNQYSVACVKGNKYYLATKLNYSDGVVDYYNKTKNNSLIVVDLLSKKVELCVDISIKEMLTFQDGAEENIALLSGGIGSEMLNVLVKNGIYDFNKKSIKIWRSNKHDFNTPFKRKILRFLYIKTKEDLSIKITTENGVYSYQINGALEEQKITLNLKAFEFDVELKSTSATPEINSLKVLAGVYE